jgi:hypothetical protein
MNAPPETIHSFRAFFDEAKAVVQEVRRSLAELLASVGADPMEPQAISRRFGLDKTLTWKVARVIRDTDPWDAIEHIPRRPSIVTLTTALAQHGAPPSRVEDVLRAIDEFDRFTLMHSDDRETLEIMVSAGRRSAGRRLEAYRKSAFQANGAIWGVRARSQISIHAMAPRAGSDMLSLATISGFDGFRRLRPDVPWAICTLSQWDSGTSAETPTSAVPVSAIEPGSVRNGVPVLADFSSEPYAAVRQVALPGGRVRFELAEGPVGNTATTTVMLGWVREGVVSASQTYPGEVGEHGVFLDTPVETFIYDLFIHRSLDFALRPTAHLYSALPGGPRYPTEGPDVGQLFVPEEITPLGCPPDITTPEFPRYRELAERAAEPLGSSLREFYGFRFQLAYPPIPTLAIMRHALRPR